MFSGGFFCVPCIEKLGTGGRNHLTPYMLTLQCLGLFRRFIQLTYVIKIPSGSTKTNGQLFSSMLVSLSLLKGFSFIILTSQSIADFFFFIQDL